MDEALGDVVARVRERATPAEAERARIERVVETVLTRATEAVDALPVDADVVQVGSTGRGTWVSGDRDVDVFVRFPPDLDRAELERYGLAVGNEVLPRSREEYAEHPYVAGEIDGVSVDLVPCFRVESATEIRSAVDRTPFHTQYLERQLDDRLAADVRVCKSFLAGIDAYGSDQRTRGFSGYLVELLVCEHGGFVELIEAAADWSPPVRLDPEAHGERTFEDPLVVVDPTDPRRNVAAVLSTTNLARFQHYARDLLADPRESCFESREPHSLAAEAIREEIAARGTTPIALRFPMPDLLDDQLYPQLRKSSAGIGRALDDQGFDVLRRDVFAADEANGRDCVLLFDLEVAERPRIERHEGPPVGVRDHARSFYETYADTDVYGPFIDGDRYVVERSREFTGAAAFLRSDALFAAALGADVETALDAECDLLVGAEVADLADTFGTELACYFAPNP